MSETWKWYLLSLPTGRAYLGYKPTSQPQAVPIGLSSQLRWMSTYLKMLSYLTEKGCSRQPRSRRRGERKSAYDQQSSTFLNVKGSVVVNGKYECDQCILYEDGNPDSLGSFALGEPFCPSSKVGSSNVQIWKAKYDYTTIIETFRRIEQASSSTLNEVAYCSKRQTLAIPPTYARFLYGVSYSHKTERQTGFQVTSSNECAVSPFPEFVADNLQTPTSLKRS
ncbi:uncharacterized protein CLUP02_11843 [Colletotrichum lupini]|uniref:Uncharacterized protein n=1 Tax=Colletotrichum lupini TaxID=145971 RepID=A0A9Q8T002_9PEZI|nr:uncharacterized protein CLUP02_11843 [Colletotrichum lupini]UQC86343.1 hypothetical protein CLUP02_11843 [Colletotrichum lupini]